MKAGFLTITTCPEKISDVCRIEFSLSPQTAITKSRSRVCDLCLMLNCVTTKSLFQKIESI